MGAPCTTIQYCTVFKLIFRKNVEDEEEEVICLLRTRRHNSVGECQMLVINMGTEAKNKKTEA